MKSHWHFGILIGLAMLAPPALAEDLRSTVEAGNIAWNQAFDLQGQRHEGSGALERHVDDQSAHLEYRSIGNGEGGYRWRTHPHWIAKAASRRNFMVMALTTVFGSALSITKAPSPPMT